MLLIENALQCALDAYAGKLDNAGAPYILHPLRVMARFGEPALQAAALLHDVVEDSEVTLADLRRRGFPERVVVLVDLLTRRNGESYMEFIRRLAVDRDALQIKKADIEDNMNALRLPALSKQDLERLAKYHKAWVRLDAAERAAQQES